MFIIVHETTHPVTRRRWFKALPEIFENEFPAAVRAEQTAFELKCRAWACEFPTPALVEVASVADIDKFRGKR